MPQDPTKPAAPENEPLISIEEFEEQARQRFNIPKKLWKAIPAQESGGNWNAQSPTKVRGKYQMTQETAKGLGFNRDDPYEQTAAAAKLLRQNYDRLEGVYADENDRWYGAAAMYYGGPNAIQKDGKISSRSLDGLSTPQRYVEQLSQRIQQMDDEEDYAVKSRANDARNLGIELEKNKIEAQDFYARVQQNEKTKGYARPDITQKLRQQGDEALQRANNAATALQQNYGDVAEAGMSRSTPTDPRQWPYVKLGSGEQLLKPGQPAPPPPEQPIPTRTWGEAVGDFALGTIAGGVNSVSGLAGLASPELGAYLGKSADFYTDMQSQALQQKIQKSQQIIAKAGETEGFWGEALAAVREYSDPALASNFVASNLASFLPAVGAGKFAQGLARGRMLARGLSAVDAGTKAEKVGAFTAQVANSILNAGGARADAYETLTQDYVKQGMSLEQAKAKAAWTSFGSAGVAAVTAFISGGTGIESRLFGKSARSAKLASKIGQALENAGEDLAGNSKGILRRIGRGAGEFLKEEGGELLEEVPSQIATNLISPSRRALQDVPQTAVQTIIGAGPTSAVSGLMGMRNDGPPGDPQAVPGDATTAEASNWKSVFAGRGLGEAEAKYAQTLDDLEIAVGSQDPNAFDAAVTAAQALRDQFTGAASPTSPRLTQMQAMLGQITDPVQIATLQELINQETESLRQTLPGPLAAEEFDLEREDFAKQYGLDPTKPLAPQVATKMAATGAAPGVTVAPPAPVDPSSPFTDDEYNQVVQEVRATGKVATNKILKKYGREAARVQDVIKRMADEGAIKRSSNNRGWTVVPVTAGQAQTSTVGAPEAATAAPAGAQETGLPFNTVPPPPVVAETPTEAAPKATATAPEAPKVKPPKPGLRSRVFSPGEEVWIGDPQEGVKIGTRTNLGRVIKVVPPLPGQRLFAQSYVVELETGQQVIVPSIKLRPNNPESRYAEFGPGMLPTTNPKVSPPTRRTPPPAPPPTTTTPTTTTPTTTSTTTATPPPPPTTTTTTTTPPPTSTSPPPTTPPTTATSTTTTPTSTTTSQAAPSTSTTEPTTTEPTGKQVWFQGKSYTLTPAQQVEWDKAENEYSEAMRLADWTQGQSGKLEADKRRKAAGFRRAAEHRRILNQPTGKEAAAQQKREEGNYIGKRVSVNGQNGAVKGNAFGKVIVAFDNGSRGTFDPDQIKPPVEIQTGKTTETTDSSTTPAGLPTKEEFESMAEANLKALEAEEAAAAKDKANKSQNKPSSKPETTSTEPTVTEAFQQAGNDLDTAARKLGEAFRRTVKAATPKSDSLSMAAGGVPINLDPAAYRELKPYFKEAFDAVVTAGESVAKAIDVLQRKLRNVAGFSFDEIRQITPYLSFYYRTEILGEDIKLEPEKSEAQSATNYSNWRELRKTQTDPAEIAARQAFNEQRRRVEHDEEEKGARGQLSHFTYKTEELQPGQDAATADRPPGLGEHKQLREALDLSPMPPYKLNEDQTNPAWREAVKDSTNAIADELFNDRRLSQAKPWTFEQAWNKLVELVEEIGQEVDPTLKQAWDRTTGRYRKYLDSVTTFLTNPAVKSAIKELDDAAANKTLSAGQFTASRKALEPIALNAGLTKNWFKNWFNAHKRRLEEYQSTGKIPSAPTFNNGSTDDVGTTSGQSSERGNGQRSGLEESDTTTPTPPPTDKGRIQTASAEDAAMWQDITKIGRKSGGSATIKQKYGEKGSWAMLINQKIGDILIEADERQTIIKECLD